MAREFNTIIKGFCYTEGPRWHDDRFWFVDFYTKQVISTKEDGSDKRIEVSEVSQQPSGLGWLPDGRLLVVSMLDAKILRREHDGTLVTHADVSDHVTGHLNDMVVDGQGRCYAGNFGFDLMGGAEVAPTTMTIVDPDGTVVHAAAATAGSGDPLLFPNGTVVTPDGRTLLVCETFGNRISAFDIDPRDGSLGPRRTWASFGPLSETNDVGGCIGCLSAMPDGCALDDEGCLWIADAKATRIVRVKEGQGIVEEIETPMPCFACALGGEDGKTMFACMAPDFHQEARKKAHEAVIATVKVEVPYAGWKKA